MKTTLLMLLFAVSITAQSDCVKSTEIRKPVLSESARKTYEANLEKAQSEFGENPDDADAIIWLGRRNAYLGEYRVAIGIYSTGIRKHPKDARLYRHRGHRYLTLRCFDDAIADFEAAAKLIRGKRDQVEPDGLPNARNIPTSTLQSNIWYHLGLAYYLKGDFKNALKAYANGLKVSKSADMFVATANWYYVTLRRLGKDKEAANFLATVKDDLDIIENDGYYKLLKVYQGKLNERDLIAEISASDDALSNASIGYGLGNLFLINGDNKAAMELFKRITSGDQWSSFGYIAAEAEIRQNND